MNSSTRLISKKINWFLIRRNRLKYECGVKRMSTVQNPSEEYVSTPQYPPILDLAPEKVRERTKATKYEEMKNVKTIEEKQIKLNMPRYYGFKCYLFKEDLIPFNSLKIAQHITRTHIKEVDELPEFYKKFDVSALCEDLKKDIEEVLLMELHQATRNNQREKTACEHEDLVTSYLVRHMNRIIINKLVKIQPHLQSVQVDYDPRIESFWFAGGMDPPINIVRYRKNNPRNTKDVNEPIDRAIQYFGSPCVSIRSNVPLPPIMSLSDSESTDFEVPFFKYTPSTVETFTEHRRATNIPGFWPGEPAKFGLISYHKCGYLQERRFGDEREQNEALHRQAILASFGWLNAQANFLGFTTFNDVTVPLVTQTIITNGRKWSFCVYQLNTLLVHSRHTSENPRKNICWITPEIKLFDEIKDGKIIGFNDTVLRNLIALYVNAPAARLGVNMQPYLSSTEKVIADYEDDDKREWLEREYKFLTSNRNRYKLDYEVYNWEKIYKIDHKTRPMDKKLRPFELHIDPFKRTLDDRQPIYVPRALRPDLPRNKGRYKKEYFP